MWRDIEDVLSRTDELLGQQVAEATRRLDRPGALLRKVRPSPTACPPADRCPNLDFGHFTFLTAMATAVCDALWGSIPMITFIRTSLSCWEPRGHS